MRHNAACERNLLGNEHIVHDWRKIERRIGMPATFRDNGWVLPLEQVDTLEEMEHLMLTVRQTQNRTGGNKRIRRMGGVVGKRGQGAAF